MRGSYFFGLRIPFSLLLCQNHMSRRSALRSCHIRQPGGCASQGLGFLSQDSALGPGGAEFSLGMYFGPDVMKGASFIILLMNYLGLVEA